MILNRSSAVSTSSRRPKFRNEPPLPTQAAHCCRQDIEMPMLSSNLLFQVFVTIQSNLCGFLLSCPCLSWLLSSFLHSPCFSETSLFNPKCTMFEAKSPRKKFNCTLGWMQHSKRSRNFLKWPFQLSTTRAN